MPVRAVMTGKAVADATEIDSYIRGTLASHAAADAFLDELGKGVDFLRDFPEGRPLCGDAALAARGYRPFSVRDFIAVYDFKDGVVSVLHIFHHSRNYANIALREGD